MGHHWDEASAHQQQELQSLLRKDANETQSDHLRERLRALEGQLGETGRYPDGLIDAGDKGQIRYQVKAEPQDQIIRINFGKPIAAIGFTLEETEQLIESLNEARMALRGITV